MKVIVGTVLSGGQIVPVTIDVGAVISPGAWTPVLLAAAYFPVSPPGYPTRGGEYRPGETASFPLAEAAAIVQASAGALA